MSNNRYNLTYEQIEQNVEAVRAWLRGCRADIYYRGNNVVGWETVSDNSPKWAFQEFFYRPTPTPKPPKYIPWTRETLPKPWPVVRDLGRGLDHAIQSASDDGVYIRSGHWTYEVVLKYCTLPDGTPAGQLVEDEG